jgi:hypothetical protein
MTCTYDDMARQPRQAWFSACMKSECADGVLFSLTGSAVLGSATFLNFLPLCFNDCASGAGFLKNRLQASHRQFQRQSSVSMKGR